MPLQRYSIPMCQAKPLGWSNQREDIRYRCALATAGKVYAVNTEEPMRGWVLNLSHSGAGFSTTRPLPPGKKVVFEMKGLSSREKYEIPAQVVHTTQQISGDWLVGLKFDNPMSNEVLDDLLM